MILWPFYGTSCWGHCHLIKWHLLTCADEGTRTLLESCFWAVGTALLAYCSVSTARLAPVSQPVLSVALCIWGLFRNEPLCMGIMWDIWASAYCSMVKVKAGQPHHWLPYPIHHLRTQTAAKLTFQPSGHPHINLERLYIYLWQSLFIVCQYTL